MLHKGTKKRIKILDDHYWLFHFQFIPWKKKYFLLKNRDSSSEDEIIKLLDDSGLLDVDLFPRNLARWSLFFCVCLMNCKKKLWTLNRSLERFSVEFIVSKNFFLGHWKGFSTYKHDICHSLRDLALAAALTDKYLKIWLYNTLLGAVLSWSQQPALNLLESTKVAMHHFTGIIFASSFKLQ